jgi:ABC-type transport system substrate-binding protein
VDGLIQNNYGSAGGYQVMTFSDSKTLDLSRRQRSEFDEKKRHEMIIELMHHLGDQMFNIPFPGDVKSFNLAWPQLANFFAIQAQSNADAVEAWPYYWYDKSKE